MYIYCIYSFVQSQGSARESVVHSPHIDLSVLTGRRRRPVAAGPRRRQSSAGPLGPGSRPPVMPANRRPPYHSCGAAARARQNLGSNRRPGIYSANNSSSLFGDDAKRGHARAQACRVSVTPPAAPSQARQYKRARHVAHFSARKLPNLHWQNTPTRHTTQPSTTRKQDGGPVLDHRCACCGICSHRRLNPTPGPKPSRRHSRVR